jgi:prophage antirepressor-like protein
MRLDADEKGITTIDTLGGRQEVLIVSEPGLYKLLATSRKPFARRFDRRVRHEILPAIRKTGRYIAPNAQNPVEEIIRDLFGEIRDALATGFETVRHRFKDQPEFWGEVQPPASLKGLDIPFAEPTWSPGNRAEGGGADGETRLFH